MPSLSSLPPWCSRTPHLASCCSIETASVCASCKPTLSSCDGPKVDRDVRDSRYGIESTTLAMQKGVSDAKRCQEPFWLFLGLPCGRRVLSRPSRATIFLDHDSSPIGHPRLTLLRIAVNSNSLCGSLTYSIQFAVLRTGQAESICLSLAVPIAQRQRLLHRHSSALDTKLARSALRSTYRHTVIKW